VTARVSPARVSSWHFADKSVRRSGHLGDKAEIPDSRFDVLQ
jgi:hypothetical protein